MEMDRIDMELLNLIQNSFLVESRPFLTLGKQVGITEEEAIQRIGLLKEKGYIRRLGGIFNSGKLGYFSTLCAIKVSEFRINEISEIINNYSGVTHNYIRNHSFNMWFTLIAPSAEKVEEILADIKVKTEINEILRMHAVRVFKVKTNFTMMEV